MCQSPVARWGDDFQFWINGSYAVKNRRGHLPKVLMKVDWQSKAVTIQNCRIVGKIVLLPVSMGAWTNWQYRCFERILGCSFCLDSEDTTGNRVKSYLVSGPSFILSAFIVLKRASADGVNKKSAWQVQPGPTSWQSLWKILGNLERIRSNQITECLKPLTK